MKLKVARYLSLALLLVSGVLAAVIGYATGQRVGFRD